MSARRGVLLGLVAGAVLRAIALPLPGTGDVLIWKVWSANAARDLTGLYGVGGIPPERRVLRWQDAEMTVDYPPVALAELGIAGRAYRAVDPEFRDTPTLNAFVKLPGIAAEIALVVLLLTWGRRLIGHAAGTWAALAIWLNPLVLLNGSVLGYLDAQMAVPIVLAVMSASAGESAMAGVLVAVAVLTKAQAIFMAPAIVVLLYRRSTQLSHVATFVAAGAVTTAALVVPFVVRGAWSNLVQAVGRLATHDMLSAQAANIWWIFTWILRVIDVSSERGWWQSICQEVRILAISRAVALGYPNARTVGLALTALAIGWACWRMRRASTLGYAAALTGWCAYAYAMLSAQVHENHWYAAVPLFGLAAGADRRCRPVFWAVTTIAALNLYFFYGLGDGHPPITRRDATWIDASVLLSFVNLGVFVYSWRVLARVPLAVQPTGRDVDDGAAAVTHAPIDQDLPGPRAIQ